MAKMVLWSAMKGRVLMNGQPAAGAVLVRNYSWHWKNEKGSDRTTANANGDFSFPAIEGSSLLGGLLPHQPVVEQVMKVEYQGKTYAFCCEDCIKAFKKNPEKYLKKLAKQN